MTVKVKVIKLKVSMFSLCVGLVGSSFDLAFSQPRTSSEADSAAAERNMVFTLAWLVDPLMFGDYPPLMRQIVDANSFAAGTASRLPSFTPEERTVIKGTYCTATALSMMKIL